MANAQNPDFSADEYPIKLLLLNSKFQTTVVGLRKKWNIPLAGYKTNKEWNEWRESLSRRDHDELGADIRNLIADFKLSDRWSSSLKQYVLDNVETRLRATPYTEWRFEYEGKASDPKMIQAVWLKVDADTTQRELVDAYKQAKALLPKKQKKQLYTYLDHALRAKELKKPNVKWSEVAEMINKEFGTNYDENYVIKMVSRLNKRL